MLRKLTLALVTSAAFGLTVHGASAQTTRQIVIEPTATVAALEAQKTEAAPAATPAPKVEEKAAEKVEAAPAPAPAPEVAPNGPDKAPDVAEVPAKPKFVHPPVYGYDGYHQGYGGYGGYGGNGGYSYSDYRGHHGC